MVSGAPPDGSTPADGSHDTPLYDQLDWLDDLPKVEWGHNLRDQRHNRITSASDEITLSKWTLLLLAIPITIVAICVFPHYSSTHSHARHPTLSNGTHPYHPTVLLISLDGFRASYFSTHSQLLPILLSLSNSSTGIRASGMQPVFPSLTFPNHWSLLTGLYPSSHGIVANDFYDPSFKTADGGEGAGFYYTDEERSWHGDWWLGEPVWSVVERAGRKAANIMWQESRPGPPVTSNGISPSYFTPYQHKSPSSKISEILSLLSLPLHSRPEFISAYFPEIDKSAHLHGPASPQVAVSLRQMDTMIGELMDGLDSMGLRGVVDVVIVSDHGMTETSNNRLIYLDDILGPEGMASIIHKDGWPSVGIRFASTSDIPLYLPRLLSAASNSNGSFAVYTHDTMPARWHFRPSPTFAEGKGKWKTEERIAEVWVVPAVGWAITDHHEHEVLFQGDYRPKGNHGYDNAHPDMQAIFLAHGPFARTLRSSGKGVAHVHAPGADGDAGVDQEQRHGTLENFENIHIFPLCMRIFGLESLAPEVNGTQAFWDHWVG